MPHIRPTTANDVSRSRVWRPREVKTVQEWEILMHEGGDLPVVVAVVGDWCQQCESVYTMFRLGGVRHENRMEFVKVDVDHALAVAEKAKVASIPTMRVYQRGVIVAEINGVEPRAVRQLIEEDTEKMDERVAGELKARLARLLHQSSEEDARGRTGEKSPSNAADRDTSAAAGTSSPKKEKKARRRE